MARARPPSRRLLAALAVTLLALGLGEGARADDILFDPDGALGTRPGFVNNDPELIKGFDWKVGNAVANAVIPITSVGGSFTTLYQASLSSLLFAGDPDDDPGAPTGLNGGTTNANAFELTIVARFREVVTSVTDALTTNPTVKFKTNVQPATSFLEVYYDNTYRNNQLNLTKKSNDLEGTGFDDGRLILSAAIQPGNDGDSTFTSQLVPVPNVPAGTNPKFPDFAPLDNDGSDQYPAPPGQTYQRTVTGSGGSKITALVDPAYASDFFVTTVLKLFSTDFNTSLKLAFSEAEPSKVFFKGSTYVGRQFTPTLGRINGINGPDFQFQADANTSFTLAAVPEPGTMVLACTGLATVSLGSLRKLRRRTGSPAA